MVERLVALLLARAVRVCVTPGRSFEEDHRDFGTGCRESRWYH